MPPARPEARDNVARATLDAFQVMNEKGVNVPIAPDFYLSYDEVAGQTLFENKDFFYTKEVEAKLQEWRDNPDQAPDDRTCQAVAYLIYGWGGRVIDTLRRNTDIEKIAMVARGFHTLLPEINQTLTTASSYEEALLSLSEKFEQFGEILIGMGFGMSGEGYSQKGSYTTKQERDILLDYDKIRTQWGEEIAQVFIPPDSFYASMPEAEIHATLKHKLLSLAFASNAIVANDAFGRISAFENSKSGTPEVVYINRMAKAFAIVEKTHQAFMSALSSGSFKEAASTLLELDGIDIESMMQANVPYPFLVRNEQTGKTETKLVWFKTAEFVDLLAGNRPKLVERDTLVFHINGQIKYLKELTRDEIKEIGNLRRDRKEGDEASIARLKEIERRETEIGLLNRDGSGTLFYMSDLISSNPDGSPNYDQLEDIWQGRVLVSAAFVAGSDPNNPTTRIREAERYYTLENMNKADAGWSICVKPFVLEKIREAGIKIENIVGLKGFGPRFLAYGMVEPEFRRKISDLITKLAGKKLDLYNLTSDQKTELGYEEIKHQGQTVRVYLIDEIYPEIKLKMQELIDKGKDFMSEEVATQIGLEYVLTHGIKNGRQFGAAAQWLNITFKAGEWVGYNYDHISEPEVYNRLARRLNKYGIDTVGVRDLVQAFYAGYEARRAKMFHPILIGAEKTEYPEDHLPTSVTGNPDRVRANWADPFLSSDILVDGHAIQPITIIPDAQNYQFRSNGENSPQKAFDYSNKLLQAILFPCTPLRHTQVRDYLRIIDPAYAGEITETEAIRLLNHKLVDDLIEEGGMSDERVFTSATLALLTANNLEYKLIKALGIRDFNHFFNSVNLGQEKVGRFYRRGITGLFAAIQHLHGYEYLLYSRDTKPFKELVKYREKAIIQQALMSGTGVALQNALRESTLSLMGIDRGKNPLGKVFHPDEMGEALGLWLSNLATRDWLSKPEEQSIFKDISELVVKLYEEAWNMYGDFDREMKVDFIAGVMALAEETGLDWEYDKGHGEQHSRRKLLELNPHKPKDQRIIKVFRLLGYNVIMPDCCLESDLEGLDPRIRAAISRKKAIVTDRNGDPLFKLKSRRVIDQNIRDGVYHGRGVPGAVILALKELNNDKLAMTKEDIQLAVVRYGELYGLKFKF